jgi:hypothetical protein
MIVFGVTEVMTGFTHGFFGIVTLGAAIYTYTNIVGGCIYAVGALLILTMKKWAAVLAVVLVAVLFSDVAGRVALVASGLHPLGLLQQSAALIVAAAIAIVFAIYATTNWKHFN